MDTPGRYDFSVVDRVLDQVDADTELWFTLGASSPWGSTRATDLLPASLPIDPDAYGAMVRALVKRCGDRVRYWQCENEPSNALFWAGTAADYAEHLAAFHRAVKEVDPQALVVLGGCPPAVFAAMDEPEPERDFFLQLIATCPEFYDVFDIHLYGDPYLIPSIVDNTRAAIGDGKPIVAGEYNGPLLVQYPEAWPELMDVVAAGPSEPWHVMSTEDFHAGRSTTEPVRTAMKALYERMDELPETLQMFMIGCRPDLEAERHRLNADDLVIRTLLALSCGIRRTVCWQLGPERPQPVDPYSFLNLLFAKFALLDFEGDELTVRHPCADAFAELASKLANAKDVVRLDHPDAYVFDLVGTGRRVGWLRDAASAQIDGVELTNSPTYF